MKFSIIAPFMASAAAVTACPGTPPPPTPPTEPTVFGIMSLRSASPIHFGQLSAAQNSVFIHLPDQGATCLAETDNQNAALFYLKDGGLYLYNGGEGPVQRLYADRSGMGQGKFGYITGDQSPPRNAELDGFAITDENLNLRGAGFIACPTTLAEGAWSVWADAGIENPGYNEGCLGLSARTVVISEPVGCQYTDYEA